MMRPDTLHRVAEEFALRGFEGFRAGQYITAQTMLRHGVVERVHREVVTELSMQEAADLLNELQRGGDVDWCPGYDHYYEVRDGRLVGVEEFTEYRFVRSALEEAGIL